MTATKQMLYCSGRTLTRQCRRHVGLTYTAADINSNGLYLKLINSHDTVLSRVYSSSRARSASLYCRAATVPRLVDNSTQLAEQPEPGSFISFITRAGPGPPGPRLHLCQSRARRVGGVAPAPTPESRWRPAIRARRHCANRHQGSPSFRWAQ